jgi:hypothetical protein
MKGLNISVHERSTATLMTPTLSLPSPLTREGITFYQHGKTVMVTDKATGYWVSDDTPERALQRLATLVSQYLK